jgi:hypothetical protein
VGSLGISFGICRCHCICLFVGAVLTIFCIVFRVLNAIFILVSLNNFVIFVVSFPFWVLVLWVRVSVLLLSLCSWVFHNLVCVVFVVY